MKTINARAGEEITSFLIRVMGEEKLPVKVVHNGAHVIVNSNSRISDLQTIWRMGMRINYLEQTLENAGITSNV